MDSEYILEKDGTINVALINLEGPNGENTILEYGMIIAPVVNKTMCCKVIHSTRQVTTIVPLDRDTSMVAQMLARKGMYWLILGKLASEDSEDGIGRVVIE